MRAQFIFCFWLLKWSWIKSSHEEQPQTNQPACKFTLPVSLKLGQLWERYTLQLRKGQISKSSSSVCSLSPNPSSQFLPGCSHSLPTPPALTITHHCYPIGCLQTSLQPLLWGFFFPFICKVLYNFYYKSFLWIWGNIDPLLRAGFPLPRWLVQIPRCPALGGWGFWWPWPSSLEIRLLPTCPREVPPRARLCNEAVVTKVHTDVSAGLGLPACRLPPPPERELSSSVWTCFPFFGPSGSCLCQM